MIKNTVRIEHEQVDPADKLYNQARIWVNGTELVGIFEYKLETRIGSTGVYQTFTVEMLANVSIEHVKPTA